MEASSLISILIPLAAIIVALTIHEFSHAAIATWLGDHTAERAGRLTLNPIAHIDPLGLLVLIVTRRFGWGKPVPFNPYNLRYPRWGPTMVALAGPASNLVGAAVASLALRLVLTTGIVSLNSLLIFFLVALVMINLGLAIFNLIPIPPLDGSKVLLSFLDAPHHAPMRVLLETRGPFILLVLILMDALLGTAILGSLFGWALGPFISILLPRSVLTGF